MSKFTKKTKDINLTVNHEGEKAYKQSDEMALYSLACTSFLADKFYETEESQTKRLVDLVSKVSPEFVAKLAVYCRTEMHLRSIPIVLLVELAKIHKGDSLVSDAMEKVIIRADEIKEILAYYQVSNKRSGTKKLNKLSKQIQKGLASAFNRFSEYQFAKYNTDKDINLKDALFLAHPKPKSEDQKEVFDRIVSNTLQVPYTWEVELSKAGSDLEKKREVWENLIVSNKLGYMALLRNLRNILEVKVSRDHINKVCSVLRDPEIVKKSKQLPFRFLSAYKELVGNPDFYSDRILNALEDAVKVSLDNIPGMEGDVVIAGDVSGSMNCPISDRSKVRYSDIALLLGQLLRAKSPNNIFSVFGDDYKIKRTSGQNPLEFVCKYRNDVGHSTNGWKVIHHLVTKKIIADKVFMFTDMQLWDSTGWGSDYTIKDYWVQYKKIAPNSKLYLFDTSGYGNTPIDTSRTDVTLISGWSDKIFQMLDALEKGSSVIEQIKKIEL